MSTQKKIQALELKREQLIRTIFSESEMIPGSFSLIYLKCGKTNCWCGKEGERGHVVNRVTWSEGGTTRTKCISDQDIQWIKKCTNNYRQFRLAKREIKQLEMESQKLLAKHEKQIVARTKKEKGFP